MTDPLALSLVKLVSELGEATSDSVVLCIEAATILGAISLRELPHSLQAE